MWAGRTICFNKKSEESVLFALFSVGGERLRLWYQDSAR